MTTVGEKIRIFPWKKLREAIFGYVAGFIYGAGVWFWIDATVWSNTINSERIDETVTWWHWIPIVIVSIMVFSLIILSWVVVEENLFEIGEHSQGVWAWVSRVWLFISLIIGVLGFIMSLWIAIQVFFVNTDSNSIYPGCALFLSCGMVFISGLLYRLAVAWNKSESDDDDGGDGL